MAITEQYIEVDGIMTPVDRVQPLVAKKLISYNGMLYTESQYERIKNAEKQHKEETDALMKKAFTPEIVEAGNDMADEHNKEMKEAAEEMNNKLSGWGDNAGVTVEEKGPREYSKEELKEIRVKYKEVTGKGVSPKYINDGAWLVEQIALNSK